MKLTTGYDFQGYFITEYIDVIFDEMLVGIGFGKSIRSTIDNVVSSFTGSEATEMIEKLNAVKSELRERVIRKARSMGANALIGIDFESSKLGDLIMVSMTATAVTIDKIISSLPVTENAVRIAEENARKVQEQEERERKMQSIREHAKAFSGFDVELVILALDELQSTKERNDFIKKIISQNPQFFPEDLIEKLEHYLRIERMYGRGHGIAKTLREHFTA